ncbi:MAG: hypothetical protein EXR21_07335 [Flavobacteriaceae bacterium]|nr:hypothetical protein [Flavobacteriaceae bacterium]
MNTVVNAFSGLDDNERHTFFLHIGFSLLDGLILGTLTLNDFVFIRQFSPGPFKVSLLFQLSVIVLPFSIFFTYFFEKVKNKKRLLYQIGLGTRIPLFLFLFFPMLMQELPLGIMQDIFLLVFLLFYFATPFTIPLINQLLKANYAPEKMGKLYSYSWSVNMLTMLVSSLIFGRILDDHPNAYVYVYPMLGLLGLVSIYLISKIKSEQVEREFEELSLLGSWKNTLVNTIDILKENKPFRDFQWGLMIYGMAFLMNLGVVALFFSQVLNLGYSQMAGYKAIGHGLSLLTFPLFGLLLDRNDPRKFGTISFTLAAVFFGFLILSAFFPFSFNVWGQQVLLFVVVGYLFYGFFQSSMTILWGIGSSYFAPPNEVATYQSIHCTLTGIRGIAAPFVGTAIFTIGSYFGTISGFVTAFGVSIVLLGFSIWLMKKSMKQHKMIIHQEA